MIFSYFTDYPGEQGVEDGERVLRVRCGPLRLGQVRGVLRRRQLGGLLRLGKVARAKEALSLRENQAQGLDEKNNKCLRRNMISVIYDTYIVRTRDNEFAQMMSGV